MKKPNTANQLQVVRELARMWQHNGIPKDVNQARKQVQDKFSSKGIQAGQDIINGTITLVCERHYN